MPKDITNESIGMPKNILSSVINSEVLNVDALMSITGWGRQEIYKKTSKNLIPYYKPNGKTIFFKKSEIEDWLLSNRQYTQKEMNQNASNYLMKNAAI